MHNPTSVLENETHKLQWDFDIQTDNLISVRRTDLIIINKKKKTCKIVDFAVSPDLRVKLKESEKKDKYLDLTGNLKKTVGHESNLYTNRNWFFWHSHRRIDKGTGGLENKRSSGDHPNYCIMEIGQNTEKGLGDTRRLAVTQTPVKDHQLTLIWKTRKK